MTKADRAIAQDIMKYRTICLVHRFLYYVKAAPVIPDLQYDMFERKLRDLVAAHPELAQQDTLHSFCPVTHVGSSDPDDYPRRVECLAESLLAYHILKGSK